MLAAIPDVKRQLETVRLALSLVASRSNVPPPLQQHLLRVISQAVSLADQQAISGATSVEAVGLALDLKGTDDLTAELRRVRTFDALSDTLAKRLLEQLHGSPA